MHLFGAEKWGKIQANILLLFKILKHLFGLNPKTKYHIYAQIYFSIQEKSNFFFYDDVNDEYWLTRFNGKWTLLPNGPPSPPKSFEIVATIGSRDVSQNAIITIKSLFVIL